MASTPLVPVYGRQFQLGTKGNYFTNDIETTPACVDATVTVSDESTNVRTITIQLKDANGSDIDYVESFEIGVFTDATRTAFATTGGSTGIAIGTDGALLALVAKKYFVATSEADGDWDGTYTDTGSESCYVGIRLPSGRWVMGSQALTNT